MASRPAGHRFLRARTRALVRSSRASKQGVSDLPSYIYPWTRLTFPHGQHDQVDRDGHGWVTPAGLWQSPEAKPLSERRDTRVVVVLGERGVGKSRILQAEHEALREGGLSCDRVELFTVSSGQIATRIARALTGVGDGAHYTFLDGLDDTRTPDDTANMIVEAVEALAGPARERLRLRIACRTSRWPSGLQTRLEEFYPKGVHLVGVAGLTRQQALAAAAERGVADPESFVAELESRRLVVPVAMWPVTFVPALEDAAAGKPLPRTVGEAYARACLQLCTEKPDGLSTNILGRRLDPSEVLVLARKAAAAMQFSARNTLSEEIDDADAIALNDLAHDSEPFGDRRVPCTQDGFRQLMQSGLMVQTGPGRRWSFAHRSFQEYLAADYLLTRETIPASIDRLLLIGEGASSRAVDAHRDVAAWVATVNDGLFEHLLAHDPVVLLRANLRARSETDRSRVFDTLLAMVRAGEDPVAAEPILLASLDGPWLAGTIAPLLDPGAPAQELYFALQIAAECPNRELTEALLDVAEAASVTKSLRTRALHALHDDVDRPEWLARLRTLAADQDPDVAAGALRRLWPGHMGTVDLLQALPTPLPDYLGMAVYFLRGLPDAIPAPDLPAAVGWAAQVFADDTVQPGYHDLEGRDSTAEEIAIRAVRECLAHPQRTALVAGLADVVLALTAQRYRYGIVSDFQRVLNEHVTARQAIARQVLDRATADQVRQLHRQDPVSVFHHPEDTAHWARELPTLPPQIQALFDEQMWLVPGGIPQWEEVYELAQEHPAVEKLTRLLFAWPVDHWIGQTHRDRLARQAQREAEQMQARFDPAALQAVLDGILTGSDEPRAAWREVVRHVHRPADGDPEPFGDQLDITAAASFPPIDDPTRAQIVRAARLVLETAPIISVDNVGPAGLNMFGQVPELWALSLCAGQEEELPDLPPERWAGLALAMFCIHGHDLEPPLRTSLLKICADRAAGGFEAALPEALTKLGDSWRTIAVSTLTESPGGTNDALLGWATHRHRTVEQWAQIMEALAEWRHQPALDAVRRAAALPPSKLRKADSTPTRRWVAAADLLIRRGHTDTWPGIFGKLEQAQHLPAALLKSFAAHDRPRFWQYDADAPTADALAQLYSILVKYGPSDEILADLESHSHASLNLVGLRQNLPWTIADRADAAALTALGELEHRHGDYLVRAALRQVSRRLIQMSWQPLKSVHEVVTTATHRVERVVTDDLHHREVVLESLDRLQDRICDDNGWATVLWDLNYITEKIKGGKKRTRIEFRPKREQDLSDFVATFLRYDLQDRRVVVNREVEITRTGLPGDRTDIQIHAHPPTGAGPETLTIVIETKGCWNRELDTGLVDQLADRYLHRRGLRTGIYLVGYFEDDRWNDRPAHASHGIKDILETQQALARKAAEIYKVSVKVRVLDCRLRGHHPDTLPGSVP